jgi:chromosome segregation ATPase
MVGTFVAGKSVYQTLDDSVRQTHSQVERCDAQLKSLGEEATELMTQRGAILLDLAHHYLPEISRETIADTFQEIRVDLQQVLESKLRRQQQLRQELETVETDLLRQQVEMDQVTEELDEKVAQREKLESEVAERLAEHEMFQQLSGRALQAEQELDRNEQRIAEIGKEVKEKRPAYEKSRLFQYLHTQGYGTPGYDPQSRNWPQGRKWGLTKRLDRWVAGMIDYARARRSYDFLRVTPELMVAEVERRRTEFNALMEQVELIEDSISDEVGLTEVLREGDRLGTQREAKVQSLEKLTKSKVHHQEELQRLESARNQYYEQAIKKMKQFLATLDEARLAERARRTPESDDDQLVQEITDLGNQLEQTRQQATSLTRERQSRNEKLHGLQQLLMQFRSAEFDSRRSHFASSFQLESHLRGYQEGRESEQQVWNTIRQHQQFAPTWSDQMGQGQWGQGQLGQGQAGGFGRGFDSELSSVLLRGLAEVAGAALRGAAYRGMQRRGPVRRQQRSQTGRPRFPRRGFTNGRGF